MANERYVFLITFALTDTQGSVNKCVKGNGSLEGLYEGRDPEPGVNPPLYNRFVLRPSLLPAGTPEIPVQIGVGIVLDASPALYAELNNATIYWTIQAGPSSPPYTRETMQALLRTSAYVNHLCTHYWQIVPGDALTVAAAGQPGDLLSKFLPLP